MSTIHVFYLGASGLAASLWLGLSSDSLFIFWVALELNLMSVLSFFLGQMETSNFSAVKYFIIQTTGSALLLLSYFSFSQITNTMIYLIVLSMGLKMALAPIHGWFISICLDSPWALIFWLATVQKVLPLYMLTCVGNLLSQLFIWLSALIPSLVSLALLLPKHLIAYSSVFSGAWLLASNNESSCAIVYLAFYSLALGVVTHSWSQGEAARETQSTVVFEDSAPSTWISWLSLGGVPPLIGFWAKVLILQILLAHKYMVLSLILVVTGVMFLFMYLRLMVPTVLRSARIFRGHIHSNGSFWGSVFILMTLPGLFL